MVVDPCRTDPESIRLAALGALRRWALRRNRLPGERADLLAAAWQAGSRNIRELASLADVARNTVYADLQGRGIDPTTRGGPVALPRAAALRRDDVAELAEQMTAVLRPAMLYDDPDPLAAAAWQLQIAMTRVAELLEHTGRDDGGPDDGGPDDGGPSDDVGPDSRVSLLEDLAYRGQAVVGYAHQVLAGETTAAAVARQETDASMTAMGLGEVYVEEFTASVGLPNGHVAQVVLHVADEDGPPVGPTGWTWDSTSPYVSAPSGPGDQLAARLDIGAAMALLATALRPSVAAQALIEQD